MFSSNSTEQSGVLQDFAEYAVRNMQSSDRVPQAAGTNRPLFDQPINSAEDVVSLLERQFSSQRERQGGMATDTPYTPASDTYEARRNAMLRSNEGVRNFAYDDVTGQTVKPDGGPLRGLATVGVGFNMDQPAARSMWATAFPQGGPNFDDVRSGKLGLTSPQIDQLTNQTAQGFEKIIDQKFAGIDMTEHQRLALLDVAYGGPAALNKIVPFMRAGDLSGAQQAVATAHTNPVVQGRYRRTANLFAGIS